MYMFMNEYISMDISGWWFATFFICPYIGNVIIPIDELLFFRGVSQPPTRPSIHHEIPWNHYLYMQLNHQFTPKRSRFTTSFFPPCPVSTAAIVGRPGGPCCHRVLCFGGGDEGQLGGFFWICWRITQWILYHSFFYDTIIIIYVYFLWVHTDLWICWRITYDISIYIYA